MRSASIDDLYAEADRFLPHVCRALDQLGLLDDILKSLLEPFYLSPRTQQLIQAHYSDHADNNNTAANTSDTTPPATPDH